MPAPDPVPLPRAMLLDLDDTILAYSASADPAWRRVCEGFAPSLGITPETLFAAVYVRKEWYWSDPDRHRRGRLDMQRAREEFLKRALADLALAVNVPAGTPRDMSRAFAVEHDPAIAPFPGAIQKLRRWRAAGLRLGLLTNGSSPLQRAKIERFGLATLFDCIAIEGEVGAGKPDPRVFHYALDRLDTRPADAWMVGDRLDWDVLGAKQLGIHAVWVDGHGRGLPEDPPARPDRVVRAITELPPD